MVHGIVGDGREADVIVAAGLESLGRDNLADEDICSP